MTEVMTDERLPATECRAIRLWINNMFERPKASAELYQWAIWADTLLAEVARLRAERDEARAAVARVEALTDVFQWKADRAGDSEIRSACQAVAAKFRAALATPPTSPVSQAVTGM